MWSNADSLQVVGKERGGSTRGLGRFESLLSRGVSQSIGVMKQRLAILSRTVMVVCVIIK